MAERSFDAGRASAVRTFAVEGQIFVSGLFWQPLPNPASAKADTLRIADEQELDLVVTRTTGALQVGLASTKDGAKEGMLSAAAAISKSMEIAEEARDFLCAVPVPDNPNLWLYVAQDGGVILHDADIVANEDEVKARLLNDMSLPNKWALIVAPAHWGIAEAQERTFVSFVPVELGRRGSGDTMRKYKKWWALKPVRRNVSKLAIRVAGTVILAVLAIKGYGLWKERAAQALLQEQLAAAARETDDAKAAAAKAAAIPPWSKVPAGAGFIDACLEAFYASPVHASTWTPRDATCSGSLLTLNWTRPERGSISSLHTALPQATVSADGNSASLTVTLASQPNAKAEEVTPITERRIAMQAVGQDLGLALSINAADAPASLPGDPQKTAAPKTWGEWKWAVQNATLTPDQVFAALDGPGLRMSRVVAQFTGPGTINWTLEGMLYAKN